MLKVEKLTKDYGKFRALNEVSFEIQKGEIVGLLGHNGAGKTTLMRIITGYLSASGGSVSIDGLDLFDEPHKVKEHIGYLPETCPLYPEMTVLDFLESMGSIRGLKKKLLKERIDFVLSKLSLIEKKNSLILNLSKGYKQRVGLAQSLIHDPELLILDEPTIGLDPTQNIEIRELIRTFAGEKTVILSSHILPEISQTCQRILIISQGKIRADGTEEELIRSVNKDQKVYIEIGNQSSEKALKVLNDIKGVRKADLQNDGIIEVEQEEECRTEMTQRLVKNQIPLLEIRLKRPSLEEVFIQLTE